MGSNANSWNRGESRGFYPKCLTKPIILFIIVIVVLFIISLVLCSSCRVVEVKSPELITIQKEIIIEPETTIQKVEAIATPELKVVEPVVDIIETIKSEFLNNGIIDDSFILKDSIFFNKNSSFMTQKESSDLINTIKDKINSAKLIILTGHACDLGNATYNKSLIEKRINRVVEVVKKQNPNIEIITSNDGQTISTKREKERRVDIYFY
ncbi:OmpA family protein [Helicobacter sp. MIT 14-3879]|uniref:OmpA family protein n=1 Tax=Helicobacter sp. MIT 14-3879 TaxID=2040649 RepID=UPI000E1F2D87|nr:OmpA family protein [Helicobacter sp. MIT 14-3879]RDU65188.1 hypothetical protein CQA44_02420 [Helicobacter sp. MIT 14-3879]